MRGSIMATLKITQIPQLNNVVIRQEGGHFFIAAPNTFIIDKNGLLILIAELIKLGFIDVPDLMAASFKARKDMEESEN